MKHSIDCNYAASMFIKKGERKSAQECTAVTLMNHLMYEGMTLDQLDTSFYSSKEI